ncbi:hypothetical protein K449DRAFT_389592 [Hypoxylon sp. EC38]|nr:hypothetical protein K449DRAFT_389592 [Hypoxylon sp. EC38]
MALGLAVHFLGTSRLEFDITREALQLLEGRDGRTVPEVALLPRNLKTFKNLVTDRLPLLDMRVMDVPLTADNIAKLPTVTASNKGDERETQDAIQRTGPISANLHYFDPVALFTGLLSSDIVNSLHLGMAHFVDEPTELYHSHSWSGSVRTTSGQFAHFIVDGEMGNPIFPSTYILYSCGKDDCILHCTKDDALDDELHIGRVYGVGKDYRSGRDEDIEEGHVVLQIQEALRPGDHRLSDSLRHVPDIDELVLLSHEQLMYIPEEYAVDVCNVTQDYWYGETMEDPSFLDPSLDQPTGQEKGKGKAKEKGARQPFPKVHRPSTRKERHPDDDWIVRVVQPIDDDGHIPLCHTHPIRAELEMQVYGRQHFREWDQRASHSSVPVASIPLLTFIDGFGLYRNVYRTLVGFYATPAGFNRIDRRKRANTFPLFISPHGTVFDDVVDSLRTFIPLDKGIEVTIRGQRVILCAFTLAYIGDMPQQNHNSGCLGPSAGKPCRFCMMGRKTLYDALENDDPSEILYFDIEKHGRFCFQTGDMRRTMDNLRTPKERQEYASQWGLTLRKPALIQISPALDTVLSRPPDAAHSEYNGMSNLMHTLLIKHILKPKAAREYYYMLRTWKFPAGWHRLQSPIHHLLQYNLSAHAKWSVIVPGLLNFWLEERHIRARFWNAAVLHPALEGDSVVEYIIRAYAAHAKSNSVLMGPRLSSEDRKSITTIIVRAREVYQQMVVFTNFTPDTTRQREGSVASRVSQVSASSQLSAFTATLQTRLRDLRAMSQGSQDEPDWAFNRHLEEVLRREMPSDTEDPDKRSTKKSRKRRNLPRPEKDEDAPTINDALRPNVHVGVHYEDIIEEYALGTNVSTLVGEDVHR